MTDAQQHTFQKACVLDDIPPVGALGVEIDGVPVAVVRSDGDIHAIYNVCSHEEVELSEGDVDDGEIECWLHGSRFDLHTGKPTGLPATEPVPVYPCKVDGDVVFVDVHRPLNPRTFVNGEESA